MNLHFRKLGIFMNFVTSDIGCNGTLGTRAHVSLGLCIITSSCAATHGRATARRRQVPPRKVRR